MTNGTVLIKAKFTEEENKHQQINKHKFGPL